MITLLTMTTLGALLPSYPEFYQTRGCLLVREVWRSTKCAKGVVTKVLTVSYTVLMGVQQTELQLDVLLATY